MLADIKGFEKYLKGRDFSSNTIESYLTAIRQMEKSCAELNAVSLLAFKDELVSKFNPKTVNLRIIGINKYLDYCKQTDLELKPIKIQSQNFIENAISNDDYLLLKNRLKADGRIKDYFIVWFLAATGARISEFLQLEIADVQTGYRDIMGKGSKIRRLYIPASLQTEMLEHLKTEGRTSGVLFLNKAGKPLTSRGVSEILKSAAIRYDLNPDDVYPHAFRHLFARNFLEKNSDIALLADLMGHESIETTRIYLRRTSQEQRDMVNRIVTW